MIYFGVCFWLKYPPSPLSIDAPIPPPQMCNLVSGWILWYISSGCRGQFNSLNLAKKQTQKPENCVLVSGILLQVVAERKKSAVSGVSFGSRSPWDSRNTHLDISTCSFLRIFPPPLLLCLENSVPLHQADQVILRVGHYLYLPLTLLGPWFQGAQGDPPGLVSLSLMVLSSLHSMVDSHRRCEEKVRAEHGLCVSVFLCRCWLSPSLLFKLKS